MVSNALAELQPRLTAADYQILQSNVAAVVNLALPQTQADFGKQKQVLAVGQLKAMAKPFYDKLRTLDAPWVNYQMYLAKNRVTEPGASPLAYSPYPWSISTSDDSNYSPATVGQLKSVFSIRLEAWGTSEPADPSLPTGPDDTDGDGVSDVTEAAMGTSPLLSDTDGDGYNDSVDAFPLDPSRWLALVNVPGDLTPPLIVLESPATATYLTGP